MNKTTELPVGTKALIFSKYYYGVLTKKLEGIEADRYFSILYFLKDNNGCTQQYICNNMAIDKTAMVKVMDYLLDLGYVSRRPNPNDRREQFVKLTAKGKKRTELITRCFEDIDKQLFEGLNRRERENFEKVLQHLTENLRAQPLNDLFFNYKRTRK